jgi:anion-transporting  ArsA/GET3 family ATPase
VTEDSPTPLDSRGIGELAAVSRMVVCCGSGGVGKTTTAAAIGLAAARRGRRVVVVTIDPARRLAEALGMSERLGNDPTRLDVDVTGELWALMLDASATFDAVVAEHASDPAQVQRILENRFYRNIADSLSGTQEYMAAEKLASLHSDDRFDLVVVDTPPTRRALDFLEAPSKLMRFLDHRLFRLVLAPTRGGLRLLSNAARPLVRTLGTVVGMSALDDAIAFFAAFDGMERGFHDRAAGVERLLADPATAYVLVASPRADTVDEAIFFSEELERRHRRVAAIVVNRLHPAAGTGSYDDAEANARRAEERDDHASTAIWRRLALSRQVAASESAAIAPLLERAGTTTAVARLPLLAEDVHELDTLAAIADRLDPAPDLPAGPLDG